MFKPWKNNPQDWEDYWSNQSVEQLLTSDIIGDLGEHSIMLQYLPKDLPVLEAGCGIGRIVAGLASHGYLVEGIDFSEPLIRRIRQVAPQLKVRVGDVYSIEASDGTYGGYISLGVLEHNPEGPLAGMKEARRVLHSRGYAFISVPYLNRAREKSILRLEREDSAGEVSESNFYQYYFSVRDFAAFLEAAGFEVVKLHPMGAYWGLAKDSRIFGWLHNREFAHRRIQWKLMSWFERMPMVGRVRWAHMMMYVCKPA